DDLLAQYHLARTNTPLSEVSPELHYTDYAVWHLHQLQTDSQAHQDFWLDYLRGGIPDFKFPYRTQDLEPQGLFAGQTLEFTIPKALSQKLRARAASQQITLQSALLGVYSHLLHQVTEQDRLAIGIATAGREHPQLENMIGVFVNFLPLISELTPDNDPVDHIRQLASQVATLNEHGTYPVEQLLDQLHFGDPQQTQLYDTALIYHTEQSYRVLKEKLQPELRVSTLPYAKQHATLPFKLDVFETRQEGPLHGALEYATNRLTADLAKQLVQAFVHLLEIWTEVETGALPVRQEMTSLAPSLLGKGVGNSQDPVQVIASFTADSLVPYLQAYASIAQLDLQVRVAPYHQVVQTIHRGQNHAFQILAVRFEDYLLNHQGSIAEKQALLRDIFWRSCKRLYWV
ncbi:MAG: condensation domain-containing protein, partial [Bacteroidota bacterium]